MSRSFDSVLVANRGEIAVRVLRSAAAAGYRTIAVYSQVDAQAAHVALADEAVLIGPAPVGQSYLDPERVLDAARRTGAQAIHPGYGFLSENSAFAAACEAAGRVFIGPSAEAIELMGNKAAAKRRMRAAGIPCIPGYQDADQSDSALLAAARDIGAPLMVKAAAGGGGRGMRRVDDLNALCAALQAARSEAENAFGSGELILEKALTRPRHVEIQIFGDRHGQVIHLGERDCSVQRRHQKVIEEAPCPVMTATLREAMGAAAVAVAQSIAYVGAGTVEFLLDDGGEFYFLEMNTRLQVEHPVTELVTGLDLVELQLRVAQGHPLPVKQAQIALAGHAIEARLYAEDTVKGFLPASGPVRDWEPPAGPHIRVDHGLCSGQVVSPFYDPMLAKIIAYGEDRDTARRRLLRALRETVILGVQTNRQFLIDVLERPRFAAAEATTAFIEEEYPEGVRAPAPGAEDCVVAAVLQHRAASLAGAQRRLCSEARLAGFYGVRRLSSAFAYDIDGRRHEVRVTALAEHRYAAALEDRTYAIEVLEQSRPHRLRLLVDGVQRSLAYALPARGEVNFQWRGRAFHLVNELAFNAADRATVGSGALLAPMHGKLLAIHAAVGDRVATGDELAVMEAMKMEHRLSAEINGVVTAVHGRVGDQFAAGAVVLEISEEADKD